MTIVAAHEPPPAAEASVIELEIIRFKLAAITAEMGITLQTTAQTREVNVGRDCVVAIVDHDGGVAALDNAAQLGSVSATAAAVLHYYQFDMKDGDVVVVSDPHQGGTHVQDVTLLAPHVIDNEILLYLAARAHMADMGGQIAGSYNPTAAEIWAEGVPIPPLKLHRHARPVRDVMSTVLLNSRTPERTRGNLDAQLASIELGRRRIEELIRQYGVDDLRASLRYAQDYTERRVRGLVSGWRDGEYDAVALLDHDAAGTTDVAVRVRVTVDGEQLTLDFSPSDPQRPSFANSTRANTVNFAMLPVLALLGDDVPVNGGVLRAVDVLTREGTLVHPTAPSPVGWAHAHPGLDVAEATAAALASAVPDGLGCLTVPAILASLRVTTKDHERLDLSPWAVGGSSATPQRDGWGRPGSDSRAEIPSVESWELDGGVPVVCIEYVADSAGAGEHRGSAAVRTAFALDREMFVTVCVEGERHPAHGCAGGLHGGASGAWGDAGPGGAAPLAGVLVDQPLARGTLALRRGGGAGYGDPLARDVRRVADDVANGYVSVAGARADYGVVMASAGDVDAGATSALRAERGGGR